MNAIGSFFRKRSLLYIALFLTLISGAGAFYHAQERLFRQEVNANLLSIAALKAQHIEQWRNERISDGATLSADNLLVGYVTRWFSQPDTMLTAKLQMRLLAIRQSQHYQDVILADANGQMRLHAEASAPLIPINAIELTAIQQAFHSRRPILTDVHVDSPNDAFPHINIVAPLFTESSGLPLGVIILRSNLDYFLYPMLQAWPVASKTAETLLVRKEGNTVLFLNTLRYRADSALRLRIPLAMTQIPAVMAIHGRTGLVEGMDYRGIPVISVLRHIPDSPWFLITKIDTQEAFADWQRQSVLILTLIGVLLTAAIGAAVAQHHAALQYRALFRAEAAQHAQETRYRITLMSVGDAVIATDHQGRVMMMNPVAEKLTGWREEEAVGHPLGEVFFICNESTREVVESPVIRVLRSGTVTGLANHTLLISRQGTEYPIADSGAPIRDEKGTIVGVVLVFRDQTDQRYTREELRRYRQHLEELVITRTAELATTKEAAEAANAAKSVFLANMSHEIRTPLNAILGFTKLLQRQNQNAEHQDKLNKMATAAHHLLLVINQVLDLAKIESGKMTLEESDFDLEVKVYDICDMVRDEILAQQIAFYVDIDPSLRARYVRSDSTQLGQALLNYLGVGFRMIA